MTRSPLSAVTVQAVYPNQWARGKTYAVTVQGNLFSSGMQVDLGKDINVQKLKVFSPTRLTMTVAVSDTARLGPCSFKVKKQTDSSWTSSPAKAWVVAPPKWTVTKPKPKLVMEEPKLTPELKGRINLIAPVDYLNGSQSYQDVLLNEQTVFSWQEANPGMAEWFEFRIVGEDGYVFEKKRIDPIPILFNGQMNSFLPTAFHMDTDFLVDLLTQRRQGGEHTFFNGLGGMVVWWEVAGYRTVTKTETVTVPGSSQSGSPKAQKVTTSEDIEVEISDRWSFPTPKQPTGLACGGSGNATSSVVVQNMDKGNRSASYPDDTWELSGNLNLETTPYAIHFGVDIDKPGGPISIYIPNAFLDWGDGSGVVPLEIDVSNPVSYQQVPLGRTYHHKYTRSGNFTVRIFVLPESDIQQGAPDALVSAYESASSNLQASAGTMIQNVSPASYDPYYEVLKGIQVQEGPGFQFSNQAGGGFQFVENPFLAMADRAHVIYCETKTIEVREDLVAQGPLHLESVSIAGYNGSGSSTTVPLPGNQTTIPIPNKKIQIPGSGNSSGTGSASGSSAATSSSSMTVMGTAPAVSNMAGVNVAPAGSGIAGALLDSMIDARVSACGILQGNADLVYYGEGKARITWSLNQGGTRMVVGTNEEALASPRRTESGMVLDESTQNTPTPESFAAAQLNSPVLEMNADMAGKTYKLEVEAEVLPQTNQLDQSQMINLLKSQKQLVPLAKKETTVPDLFSWLVPEAHAAGPVTVSGNSHIANFKNSGVKLSILAPSKEGLSGRPVMASLNHFAEVQAAPAVPQFVRQKPYYVKSEPFTYMVQNSDPEKPCKFVFPVAGGDAFDIYNLEVNKAGTKFTGNGVLDLHLYTGQGGTAERFILPVAVAGWTVAQDGMTVASGNIQLNLDYAVNDAGMRLQLKKLSARAGQTPMNLTMTAKPADTDLHLQGGTQAPAWTATAPVSSSGNWYYREGSTLTVALGNSGFFIKPKEMVIDLSSSEGMAANPNNAGKEWAGLHFGEDAVLVPNLFDFQVPDANKAQVSNWGVVGTRLTGKTTIATPFSADYKKGTIGFESIDVDTGKSNLAIYRNMDVHVPWLDTHLKGNARIVCGVPGQEAYFEFGGIVQEEVEKTYKGMSMTVKNLVFGNFSQTGWGAWSESTAFSFEAENVMFAENILVPGITYSMDGRPFLEDGSSIQIPLGGKSFLGFTPVDLVSLAIDFHSSGSGIFSFEFTTKFAVSEVLPSVDVPIRYGLSVDGNQYRAEGPYVTPFDIPVAFPAGQPRVEAAIHVEYSGEGLSAETSDADSESFWPFGVATAYADTGPQDRFCGSVDMKMFGNAPIQAEFRLGYMGGHDYWLVRATLDLGPEGIPFIPPFLKMYKIRGGLGHNFPLDAFKSTSSLEYITPVTDDSYIFMAGIRVGSTDGFICTMDGDMTIKPGEGARLDFRAWLLDSQPSGQGNFHGYLQYAADAFDGALSGHLGLLADAVYFDIPENACVLHFGKGQPWHIYAGRDVGPKIRMHLLISDMDGYMMLDDEGLRFGGGMYYYLGASIGHISGTLETGLTLTPEPHIAGYAEGGVHADVCAHGACVGTGISVRVDLGALPVSASARGCVKIPIPFWNPKVCATFSI